MIKLLLLVFFFQGLSALCPEAFERHGDSCYKPFALKATWAEAKAYCKIFGGDLAVIETPTEEMIIEGILRRSHGQTGKSPENYWIDGSDILEEGTWRWMKDEGNSYPITGYTNWNPGQPDNDDGIENCLELRFDFGMHWNDDPCDYKESFLCEASTQWEIQGTEVIG